MLTTEAFTPPPKHHQDKKKCMGFGWYILKVQLLNSPKKVKSKFLCDSLMRKLVFKIRPFSALFFAIFLGKNSYLLGFFEKSKGC